MVYRFRCMSCGAEEEKEIRMEDYPMQKDRQVCGCGGKMKRVIEWQGFAKGGGAGWCGKSTGNAI